MNKQEQAAALAAEKQKLIREGELYRIKVVHSKALVGQALHPEALLHGAVEHAVSLAQARLGGLLQPGGLSGGLGGLNFKSLKSLMPYALTIGSFIARKRLIKPAIALAVVAGAGVAWLLRHKRPPEA
ncbi:hypothetical protein SAMN05216319_0156 [Duganella sp. CF402]|uniref:hypothetical protein n=1 Tax=unclassified Duganella TaxID=2636909 RepID=UPI0008B5B8E1|nr:MULTISPECIES: hypothetical protein [unclassified Duganella]RZT11363.1 hypothetical protein EV582_3470 [Duganella sp. BK701]SEK68125.1 hypothetical protein SAMN05216319_0156 [Duganella sp. CF402]